MLRPQTIQIYLPAGEARYSGILRINYLLGDASHPITLAPLPHPSPPDAS